MALLSQPLCVQAKSIEGKVVDYSPWTSIEQIKTEVPEEEYFEELERKSYEGTKGSLSMW